MFAKITFIPTVCGIFTKIMFIPTFCGMFTKITLIPTFCCMLAKVTFYSHLLPSQMPSCRGFGRSITIKNHQKSPFS